MNSNTTSMTLFNSLTHKKEILAPINNKKITIYACGPTVYNKVHIGNLRTFLVEDTLVRFLAYKKYSVKFVMNFTDVDDKTIKGAFDHQKKLPEFTKEYESLFLKDIETLNFIPTGKSNIGDSEVEIIRPSATDYIDQMIQMIQMLLDKGYTYKTEDGSVYFAINKYKDYGALSGFKQEDLIAGASERVLKDEYEKETAADFVLWKAEKKEDHGNAWDSPFGKGRPGWHIECSAMSHEILGSNFDIHCGGIDNLFPHHENEIAQSKCCFGGDFANLFFHVAHLKIDHKKMSKSLGNFYTLTDLTEMGYSPNVIRYALLSTHYKQELLFSLELLDNCQKSFSRIHSLLFLLTSRFSSIKENLDTTINHTVKDLVESAVKNIEDSMSHDLNIPKALGFVFNLVRDINRNFDTLTEGDQSFIFETIKKLDKIFGFFLPIHLSIRDSIRESIDNNLTGLKIVAMLEQRKEAKANKDFKKADEIRDDFLKEGIELIDHKDGTTSWRFIK